MKKLLIMVIGVTALCIHGATLEEKRELLREFIRGGVGELTPDEQDRRWQVRSDANSLVDDEPDFVLSVYCEILEDKFDDPNPGYVDVIIPMLNRLDGKKTASCGNPKVLDLMRRLLKTTGRDNERPRKTSDAYRVAQMYLAMKGDARDIDTVDSNHRLVLERRVAGTNIMEKVYLSASEMGGMPWSFYPSVANTGPQELYVREILRQYWGLEVLDKFYTDAEMFRMREKVYQTPDELLTLVVWFDEDGNPVCNVDLAKYGLTMPEIDLPQSVKDKIPHRARPEVATASLPSEDETQRLETVATIGTPPRRPWLYVGLFSLLCASVALWLIRKK